MALLEVRFARSEATRLCFSKECLPWKQRRLAQRSPALGARRVYRGQADIALRGWLSLNGQRMVILAIRHLRDSVRTSMRGA